MKTIIPDPGDAGPPLQGAAWPESEVPLASSPALELWGGVECTFNRVGGRYFSQLAWSGHLDRPGDLDLFASLGIRAMRYPLLWEMLAPSPGVIHWAWADERLGRLRELGVRPIVGLVHHGSGPPHAPVETPAFAPGLAEYAANVARRFPWIDSYTPVNEPVTTARFCGLYRLWHPHGGNPRIFIRILLNECHGTVLAMRAIREVNRHAKLIQPDDLGRVYGTGEMSGEIDFQNHRRWLGWDLLCGRVTADHALWPYLLANGISERELCWFHDNVCPPDIVGINHYPTSDRYLDHATERYPGIPITRDAGIPHVDLEAVRVRPEPLGGFHERLMEAWNRYHLPLAITESHLGCTREEQLRWFAESWSAAGRARREGAEVIAVTAWSLLGSHNWNSLVTRDTGYYEPGVFDVRGREPRPTAIATILKGVGESRELSSHPLLDQPGWWDRPLRFLSAGEGCMKIQILNRRIPAERASPLLVLGGSGILGRCFVEACQLRGLAFSAPSRAVLDLGDGPSLRRSLAELRPWAVVNAACCRGEAAGRGGRPRSGFPTRLAAACRDAGVALMCFSTPDVFDGKGDDLYLESHAIAPMDSFGQSKADMEKEVLTLLQSALVIRSGPFFGAGEQRSMLSRHLKTLLKGRSVTIADESIVSPTYLPDLVCAALDLLIDGAGGIWHLANEGQRTWVDALGEAAGHFGLMEASVSTAGATDTGDSPRHQRFSALGTERGQILPTFEDALERYANLVGSGSQ